MSAKPKSYNKLIGITNTILLIVIFLFLPIIPAKYETMEPYETVKTYETTKPYPMEEKYLEEKTIATLLTKQDETLVMSLTRIYVEKTTTFTGITTVTETGTEIKYMRTTKTKYVSLFQLITGME